MKVLLMSDTHGALTITQDVIQEEHADMILHMGDVGFDPHNLGQVYYVKGNHDSHLHQPKERLLTLANQKIYMTHGDLYEAEVFANLKKKDDEYWLHMERCMEEFTNVLAIAGKAKHANIVCFGHTHYPQIVEKDGILLINPGSLAIPSNGKQISYAVLQLEHDRVEAELKYHPWDEK